MASKRSDERLRPDEPYEEPTERSTLLPRDANTYLSPDDPAVSPYNLWSVRALHGLALVGLAVTFIWWTFLLVSTFVSPPKIYSRGSGFLPFSYTMLANGYLLLGILFFSVPSKAMTVWSSVLAVLMLVDMCIIVAVPRIRLEEGWIGIASVVWISIVALYEIMQNGVVAWGKREEEERLTGREETRRSVREWLAVTIEMVVMVVMAIVAILFTATLILRASDAGLAPTGNRYYVHGDTYQIHLACVGNRTEKNRHEPTILLEGDYGPVEHTLQPFIDEVYARGIIGRYCYWDRPGIGFSDNAPSPHSAGMSADVLSEALVLANESGPWIVVSAGVGSLHSRIFASRHLLQVSGIFLIDPVHESYLGEMGRSGRGFVLWLRGVISPLGLDRLTGLIVRGRNSKDRVIGRSAYQSDKFIKAKLQENLVALTMTQAEVKSARHIQMSSTPLVVVSSGNEMKDSKWAEKQEDLTGITSNLLSWDVVQDAPHSVWESPKGRQVLETRLRDIVKDSKRSH